MSETFSHTRSPHVKAVRVDGGTPGKNGKTKSLWARQRFALVYGAYRAMNAGDLQMDDLRAFLETNVTVPIAPSLYDAVMGSGSSKPKGMLTQESLDRLLDSAERTVREHYDREGWEKDFSERQRRRAELRWEKERRTTVADLDECEGLSKAQTATVLGCSPATVARRRKEQRAQALTEAAHIGIDTPEHIGIDTPEPSWQERWDALMALEPVPASGPDEFEPDELDWDVAIAHEYRVRTDGTK